MLSFDLATIIFQIINFVVLAFVLNRWVFRPLLRQAAQRAAERERLMQEVAAERQKLADVRTDLEKETAAMEDESDRVLAEVRQQSEADQQELLQLARSEAERMLVEAQADAQRLRRQSLEEFGGQLVDAVLHTSGKIMGQVTPAEVHDRLVQRLTERIREMGRADMARVEAIRRSLRGREVVAYVTSARELSSEQQAQLARILSALADHRVDIELSLDPDLVAGVRVRLGDTVMDSSLAGQLLELRDEVSSTLKERFNGD